MKYLKFRTTGRLVSLMCTAAFLCALSSCVKTNNNDYNTQPVTGFINVVQASPDEPPLNFYLNKQISNAEPLQFGSYTDYFRAATGAITASFDNSSTNTQVASNTINISQNQYYSLFLVNTPASPQYLLLTDMLSQPATGQAGIRFINLSPDAGNVDFTVKTTSTKIADEGFTANSPFVNVAPGTYALQVTKAGTTTVLASLPTAKLVIGGVYTVWLQGLSANLNSGDALSINLMQNAQFSE